MDHAIHKKSKHWNTLKRGSVHTEHFQILSMNNWPILIPGFPKLKILLIIISMQEVLRPCRWWKYCMVYRQKYIISIRSTNRSTILARLLAGMGHLTAQPAFGRASNGSFKLLSYLHHSEVGDKSNPVLTNELCILYRLGTIGRNFFRLPTFIYWLTECGHSTEQGSYIAPRRESPSSFYSWWSLSAKSSSISISCVNRTP